MSILAEIMQHRRSKKPPQGLGDLAGHPFNTRA
jgi:hypothetical protein